MSEPSLEATVAQHSIEITQIAKTLGEIWNEIKENRRHSDSNFDALANRLSSIGRPNIPAIVSVCVLIGSIAVAFIAPIKADITRGEETRKELALAVVARSEAIQAIRATQVETVTTLREAQKGIESMQDFGTRKASIQLAQIERDLEWMRGARTMKPKE